MSGMSQQEIATSLFDEAVRLRADIQALEAENGRLAIIEKNLSEDVALADARFAKARAENNAQAKRIAELEAERDAAEATAKRLYKGWPEQADRIDALEAALRDARGYAALALDRPTLHNRGTLTSIIQALDRAALPQPQTEAER